MKLPKENFDIVLSTPSIKIVDDSGDPLIDYVGPGRQTRNDRTSTASSSNTTQDKRTKDNKSFTEQQMVYGLIPERIRVCPNITLEEHLVMEHVAGYVSKYGEAAEIRLKLATSSSAASSVGKYEKVKKNPNSLPFLDIDHPHRPYYEWLKVTKATLEERAPHLLPLGWNLWRKVKKSDSVINTFENHQESRDQRQHSRDQRQHSRDQRQQSRDQRQQSRDRRQQSRDGRQSGRDEPIQQRDQKPKYKKDRQSTSRDEDIMRRSDGKIGSFSKSERSRSRPEGSTPSSSNDKRKGTSGEPYDKVHRSSLKRKVQFNDDADITYIDSQKRQKTAIAVRAPTEDEKANSTAIKLNGNAIRLKSSASSTLNPDSILSRLGSISTRGKTGSAGEGIKDTMETTPLSPHPVSPISGGSPLSSPEGSSEDVGDDDNRRMVKSDDGIDINHQKEEMISTTSRMDIKKTTAIVGSIDGVKRNDDKKNVHSHSKTANAKSTTGDTDGDGDTAYNMNCNNSSNGDSCNNSSNMNCSSQAASQAASQTAKMDFDYGSDSEEDWLEPELVVGCSLKTGKPISDIGKGLLYMLSEQVEEERKKENERKGGRIELESERKKGGQTELESFLNSINDLLNPKCPTSGLIKFTNQNGRRESDPRDAIDVIKMDILNNPIFTFLQDLEEIDQEKEKKSKEKLYFEYIMKLVKEKIEEIYRKQREDPTSILWITSDSESCLGVPSYDLMPLAQVFFSKLHEIRDIEIQRMIEEEEKREEEKRLREEEEKRQKENERRQEELRKKEIQREEEKIKRQKLEREESRRKEEEQKEEEKKEEEQKEEKQKEEKQKEEEERSRVSLDDDDDNPALHEAILKRAKEHREELKRLREATAMEEVEVENIQIGGIDVERPEGETSPIDAEALPVVDDHKETKKDENLVEKESHAENNTDDGDVKMEDAKDESLTDGDVKMEDAKDESLPKSIDYAESIDDAMSLLMDSIESVDVDNEAQDQPTADECKHPASPDIQLSISVVKDKQAKKDLDSNGEPVSKRRKSGDTAEKEDILIKEVDSSVSIKEVDSSPKADHNPSVKEHDPSSCAMEQNSSINFDDYSDSD